MAERPPSGKKGQLTFILSLPDLSWYPVLQEHISWILFQFSNRDKDGIGDISYSQFNDFYLDKADKTYSQERQGSKVEQK